MSRAQFTKTTNGMTVTIDGQEYGISLYPISHNPIPVEYVGKTCDKHKFVLNRESVPTTDTQKDLYNQYKILYSYYNDMLPKATEVTKLFCELIWRNNIEFSKYKYLISDINRRTDIIKADISKVVTKLLNKEIDTITIKDIENEAKQRYVCKIQQLPIKSAYLKEKLLNIPRFWQLPDSYFNSVIKWQTRLTADLKRTDHIIEEVKRIKAEAIPHYLQEYIYITESNPYHYLSNSIEWLLQIYADIDSAIRFLNTTWNDNPMTAPELRNYLNELENQMREVKEEKAKEEFTIRQSKLNNIWDNDNYKIIIPLTKDDCIKIGNKFRNCFGTYEWYNYFRNGYRYGACVIDKHNKPVICLDIDTSTKQIMQYLGPNNNRINNPDLIQLKEEIRKVLLKNIIKGDE